ncbi:UvrD-helicase domain-containing protein [Brachybacterium sp. YJGR34]|uniref:HelD family protein n=1 Tax=Brachybacterium sp. YJGR34 TaxID=2059911 RepID=UPI000E09E3F4|nr:UvrD-helicase domain-containing protein [Brachybacterium sp. YJGR34]
MTAAEQIAAEQHHLDRAHRRRDAELAELEQRRTAALARDARSATDLDERDAEVRRLGARLTALMHAESTLCFGRLDREDGLRVHIGPVGLRDGDERLVIDWRAPAAAAFYAATARSPQGLLRRRHITLEGRRVIRVDDDLLGGTDGSERPGGDAAAGAGESELVGEGALLRALGSSRDGRMHQAVATLQAEQDAIIRAPRRGTLVVQGAPGTGKTVVALHRAAYLLYSALEVVRRGVLIIGPNSRFLGYIGDVLPALGETNVVTSTIEGLLPDLGPTRPADRTLQRLLGDEALAGALDAFLTGLQGASAATGHPVRWDGEEHLLDPEVVARCADRAQKHSRHHNIAREHFRELILEELTDRVAAADAAMLEDVEEGFEDVLRGVDAALDRGSDALMPVQEGRDAEAEQALARRQLRTELEADASVTADLEELWPHLSPEEAVTRFLREGLDRDAPPRPGTAEPTAPRWSADERAQLAASVEAGWTDAHVPLLDEAAELLGLDESEEREAAARAQSREIAHAQRVIAATPGLAGLVSAEDLAERSAATDSRDLATRALADRSWTYGHIIVDEAQELTPMQWRMLARRCPTRSLTVVGDIAQTAAPLETATWADRLSALRTEPRLTELTICYRSPRELVEAVAPLLHELRPDAREIDAVRSTGRPAHLVDGAIDEEEQVISWARSALGAGQRAIITPEPSWVLEALAGQGIAASDDDLRESLVVLPVPAAKGLEFDHVLVHAPDRIEAEHGTAMLYVALTRATSTLVAVQQGSVQRDLGPGWERGPLA